MKKNRKTENDMSKVLFGNRGGKSAKTHWVAFIKEAL